MTDKIIVGCALLALLFSVAASLALDQNMLAAAISIGFISSVVYIVIGFISINNAFEKPIRQFYKAFANGLLLRFSLFVLTMLIIHKFTDISLIYFTLSFMLFYIIFQSVEIRLIWKKLENRK